MTQQKHSLYPWSKSDLLLLEKSQYFNADWYLSKYQDVATAGYNPLEHYLLYGAVEGRDPGPEFSTAGYMDRYPDVAAAGINPLLHYLRYGQKEGRDPAPVNEADNLTKFAEIVRKSELFNEAWYLSRYPSIAADGVDPVLDYLQEGFRQGRNPSPEFDTDFYLAENRDVAVSGKNPLVHYLLYGIAEGRLPKAGRAHILEKKLWGGFAGYALQEIEAIKHSPENPIPEKISAAWTLMVWYASHGKYVQAFDNFAFACGQRATLKSSKKWVVPAACCQVKMDECNSARKLLANTLEKSGFDPDCCLVMANTAPAHDKLESFADSDSFRLNWINKVFTNGGLAPIVKRDASRGLALDNLNVNIEERQAVPGQRKISIIMPIYNAASTLAIAIDSVLCQTWRNLELILVDDCSTDDSMTIAQQIAAKDSRVTVIRQRQNMGAYAARNVGVRHSIGDFITVHDSDDWSHPQKLERQMSPLLSDSSLLGSFSFWVKVDWEMQIVGGWRPWGNIIEFNHSSFLFRRSLVESLGQWDNVRVAGDTEFIWRAEAKYGKEAFVQVCEDVPLSFSLASQTSLTQVQHLHVKTVFYGLRRIYREASQWWHAGAKKQLHLANDESNGRRPFPVPNILLGLVDSDPIAHVLVGDFSRTAMAVDSRPLAVLTTVSRICRTALFHWPDYSFNGDDPIDDRVFETAEKNNVRLLVPGETIDSGAVVIVRSKAFGWLPDSLPIFKSPVMVIIEDAVAESGGDEKLQADIQQNIELVFGVAALSLSLAGFLELIHRDAAYPLSIMESKSIMDLGSDEYIEITESGLFSADWYLDQYQDVAASGQDPLRHYLSYGADEGRDPGPDFSSSGYLAHYQDVACAGINPLLHYIRYGKSEGRITGPCLDPWAVRRPYDNFSAYLTYSMLDPLVRAPFGVVDLDNFKLMEQVARRLCLALKDCAKPPLVSVIMPMRDRAEVVGDAVRSVLAQSYENFELLVVDDGSRDDSVAVVRSIGDSRLLLLTNEAPNGVSRARNLGLTAARGELIAYLDSDNTWRPDYLCAMVGFFRLLADADAAYCGQYLYRAAEAEPFGVRFASYNPSLLRNRNYIDLNCFVHRRSLLETIGGGFCEDIKRWVDWELILRLARKGKIYSVPIVQSNYFLDRVANTITACEELEPARQYILDRAGYGREGWRREVEERLTKKVAVIVLPGGAREGIAGHMEALAEQAHDPLVQLLVIDQASEPGTASDLTCWEVTGGKVLALPPGSGVLQAIDRAARMADPDSDLLVLESEAMLTPDALPALQKAAYASASIAVTVPQQVLPGGERTINSHVPYANDDIQCDVTLSGLLKNVEPPALFHNGQMMELNFASFFCLYIKGEVWSMCGSLAVGPDQGYRAGRLFGDFIRHVLAGRIVYTPEAVVLKREPTVSQYLTG